MPQYLIGVPISLSLLINCLLISFIPGLLRRIIWGEICLIILRQNRHGNGFCFTSQRFLCHSDSWITSCWGCERKDCPPSVIHTWSNSLSSDLLWVHRHSRCRQLQQLTITCRTNSRQKSFWTLCCWRTPKIPNITKINKQTMPALVRFLHWRKTGVYCGFVK